MSRYWNKCSSSSLDRWLRFQSFPRTTQSGSTRASTTAVKAPVDAAAVTERLRERNQWPIWRFRPSGASGWMQSERISESETLQKSRRHSMKRDMEEEMWESGGKCATCTNKCHGSDQVSNWKKWRRGTILQSSANFQNQTPLRPSTFTGSGNFLILIILSIVWVFIIITAVCTIDGTPSKFLMNSK